METLNSKREILKNKVVNLVKDFIQKEGGITGKDLQILFGKSYVPLRIPFNEVAQALSDFEISLT